MWRSYERFPILAGGIDPNRFGPWLRGWGLMDKDSRMGRISGLEVYDLLKDPGENHDLDPETLQNLSRFVMIHKEESGFLEASSPA
jgi:hypothetical protein